jgi:hypothetical protein
VPGDATIGWPKYSAAASGNAVLSVCALSASGHAQGIPGRITVRLPLAAAVLDGWAGVHAASTIARPTVIPMTPAPRPGRRRPRLRHDNGLAIGFPTDPMLAIIDASLSAGNGGAAVATFIISYITYRTDGASVKLRPCPGRAAAGRSA